MKNHKDSFLIYIDDDDKRKEAYVEVLESNENFIKFATVKNIITIPTTRIVKLKEQKPDQEE